MAIIDKPSDYFNTVVYTGNGSSSHGITGVGFKPDWTWIKSRSNATDHILTDIVRGVTVGIKSNTTAGNATDSNQLKSFDSDGFTLGSENDVNGSSRTYASWNWLAGGSQGSSNTDGSINTTYTSVNTTSGFSIVSWTGNGSNGATIGHGLGATPAFVITKRLNSTGDWQIGGSAVDAARGGANSLLLLNATTAMDSNSEVYQTFSSTTFQVGVNASINTNGGTLISYCFAEKQGYSKFGSYTGNNNVNGPFVYLGFKPAWLMVFAYQAGNENWMLVDNKRDGFNVENEQLFPNTSIAEESNDEVDLLSNGFKLRRNNSRMNGSNYPYIYMAFAENPFVASNFVPTTAR